MPTTYDVFARKEHPEPLLYIGSIEVEQAEQVAQTSLEQFGPESEWLEMIAVPRQAVILVFSEKEGVKA
ncbi:MAG: hypothetical protein KJ077_04500 [Anaerolineae bacterium]|nr:hypothetical protein [Anaerolineae bacterium]